MVEKVTYIRTALKGDDDVKRRMLSMGDVGERAFSRIERSAKGPTAGLKAINAASREAQGGLQNLAGNAGILGNSLGAIGPKGLAAAAAFGVIAISINKAIDASSKMDAVEKRLEFLTKSANAAAAGMDFIAVTAQRQSVDISGLGDAYARLIPQVNTGILTMSEMQRLLVLMNDTASIHNLSTSQLGNVYYGLSQALSQGRVQLQELNQVTEPVPGLLDSLARAAGTNASGFRKMTEEGEVTSKMLKDLLLKALQENEGAAEKLGDSWPKAMIRMENATTRLYDAIGDTGLVSAATKVLEGFAGVAERVAESIKTLQRTDFTASLSQGIGESQKNLDITKRLGPGAFESEKAYQNTIDRYQGEIDYLKKRIQEKTLPTVSSVSDGGREAAAQEKATKAIVAEQEKSLKIAKMTAQQRAAFIALERAENEAKKQGVTLSDAQKKEVQALALAEAKLGSTRKESNKAAKDANKLAETRAGLEQKIIDLREETDALSASGDKEADIQRKVNQFLKQGNDLRKEERDLLAQQYEGEIRRRSAVEESIKAQEKAAEDLARAQEEAMRPFQHAMDNIQDAFADMLMQGKFSFESLADIAKKMAAEVAAAWIIKPVIGATFGGMIPTLGGSAPAASAGGGFSGVFGSISPSNIFSAGGLLGGGGANLGQTFNNAVFGLTGNYQAAATAYNIGTNFTPGAGLAGLGGGLLSSAIFGGGTGNQIGSTLGGLVGTAFGGPVGSLLGSFAGGALGSLFGGGKPSDKTAGVAIDANTGQVLQLTDLGKKTSDENKQARDTIAAAVAQIRGTILGDVKTALEPLFIEVGSRDGVRFAFGGGERAAVKDVNDLFRQISDTFAEQIPLAQSLQDALGKVDFTDLNKGLADVAFITGFDKLGDAPEKLSEVELAIKALNDNFTQIGETAKRLGLDLEKVNDAKEKQMLLLRTEFEKTSSNAYLSSANPMAAGVVGEIARYQQAIKDATALGADTKYITLDHQSKMLELEKQIGAQQEANIRQRWQDETAKVDALKQVQDRWKSFANQLTSSIEKLRLGALSPLSPEERLREARSRFEDVSRKAALGDDTAIGQLDEVGNTFLELSKAYFASSADYARDFGLVEEGLRRARDTAERQVDAQQRLIQEAMAHSDILRGGFNNVEQAIESLKVTGPYARTAGADRLAFEGSQLTQSQYDVFRRSLGYTGEFGSGGFSQFLAGNSAAEAQYYAGLRALGVPGYATGGVAEGWAMVGERGPELAYFGQQARIYPNGETRQMLSSSNDNGAVVRAINGLGSELKNYRGQSANETEALRREIASLKAENAQLSSLLMRNASR